MLLNKRYIYKWLFRVYSCSRFYIRNIILHLINKFDGGEFYSQSIRDIYRHYHEVEVGLYTQGAFSPSSFIDKHTKIGRYCSIAAGVCIFNRNHPLNTKSTHAFFFNPILGICNKDYVEYTPLEIGNDVWIGRGAIIQPHVRMIGTGAVIGAGAVVNKDVPPYAVIVGNPSRIVRYRFSKEIIEELLASRWWEKSIEELKPYLQEFQRNLGPTDGRDEGV